MDENWLEKTRENIIVNPPVCDKHDKRMTDIKKEPRSYGEVIIFGCFECEHENPESMDHQKVVMLEEKKKKFHWLS